MSSRAKGVRFEREVAQAFEAAGFTVRGLEGGGDHLVVSDTLVLRDNEGTTHVRSGPNVLHIEAKRQERLRVPEWLEQQERDCPAGVRRALVFRQSRKPAYVIEPLDQFLDRERRLRG